MKRNNKFYFDPEYGIVRIKDISIFGSLVDLTFKSVEVNGKDFKLSESYANGQRGYRVGNDLCWRKPFDEAELLTLVGKINGMTDICEQTIKNAVEKYEYNKKYVFNPTIATQKEGLSWFFFICLRPTDIYLYFNFLENQEATKYIVEYRKYVLKEFQKQSNNGNYQFDMVVTVEPYLTWLDQNKAKLDEEKHRAEENKKCADIFDMIRRA